ncbi:MAG: hypothetical protein MZV63_21355 [Marinilabiliales bacterium]|nr:hypothetical protein [Marinilabiliales bacterium]
MNSSKRKALRAMALAVADEGAAGNLGILIAEGEQRRRLYAYQRLLI